MPTQTLCRKRLSPQPRGISSPYEKSIPLMEMGGSDYNWWTLLISSSIGKPFTLWEWCVMPPCCCCCCSVALVISDSVRPHRWQPTRLLCPWDSPGKNTGVGCHFLLQCTKVKSESEVAQSCPTLSDPMDCSLPGSSVHGIFQARVLRMRQFHIYINFFCSDSTLK